jgi:ABC-type phosphate/phosphonate transport system substrate-binding protein
MLPLALRTLGVRLAIAGFRLMRARHATVWVSAVLLTGLMVWPNAVMAKITLVFGTYSADKPTAMVAQLRPSLNRIAFHLAQVLGEEVEIDMNIVRSYDAGAELIITGTVDFMRLGPATYVKVKERNPGVTILAMEKKNGKKRFNGVIAVHTDSDITEVSQLRGRSFAFGSVRSTLGRYFSQLYLMRNGIRATDLSNFEYLGRHDKVGRAVGSGQFDAGALEGTTFAKLVANGVPLRAIATFENSTRPWVARAGLETRIVVALREALSRLDNDEALMALRFEGFLPGEDSEYEPTREAIRENPRFFEQITKKP